MPEQRFEIDGQPDFELGTERTRKVTILAELPESEKADGLVFLIPGMGGDKDADYSTMLRRYISARYNMAVVSVDGHCNTCRPMRSKEFGDVGVDIEPSSLIAALGQFIANGNKVDRALNTHNDILGLLRSDPQNTYRLRATLVPPDGQYQNFGVLAALDHIAALHHLIDEDVPFDTSNIVCLGSSHGGYIAHMMHKFAPNTFNGVIDASAYSETVTKFLDGQGGELDLQDGNFAYACSTVQRWQFRTPGKAGFFGPDRALIRDTGYHDHMVHVAEQGGRRCQFRMLHSKNDLVSSPMLKARQADLLSSLGFDVTFDLIGEEDVDGKFIKSADHGMGVALNLLFDKYYPTLERRDGKIDRELATVLRFEGPKMDYTIGYRSGSIHADARCEGKYPPSDAEWLRAAG